MTETDAQDRQPAGIVVNNLQRNARFRRRLYQYFCELGAEVVVRRNDELSLSDIETLAPQKIGPRQTPRIGSLPA
jgi:anthranilate/para-aminobenzoate synthase component II